MSASGSFVPLSAIFNAIMFITPVIPAVAVRLLTLLSLGLLLMTCKSQEDMLPSATQTGQNTFGCLIDGKSYVPDGRSGFMAPKAINGGFLYSVNDSIVIWLTTYAKDGKQLDLYIDKAKPGIYNLNQVTGTIPAALDPKNYGQYFASDGTNYITSSRSVGQITIAKADTATGIIAGTFHFMCTSASGATVNISDGRFDVNSRTLPR